MTLAKTPIDTYIAAFPKEVQALLEKVRAVIRKEVPEAEEAMKYGIPTFILHGNLVHFAAYKNHLGFYPGASGIEAFKKELSKYKGAKGSVQFPFENPIPFDLIKQIAQFRLAENIEKANAKRTLKKCSKGHKYYKSKDMPMCPICEEEKKYDVIK